VEERGWEYRRRQPEGTVLYEAVRENLATLLAEAGELGCGLLRYVERDGGCPAACPPARHTAPPQAVLLCPSWKGACPDASVNPL
jgi:hypothetical protein